jgi:hypothetical protein
MTIFEIKRKLKSCVDMVLSIEEEEKKEERKKKKKGEEEEEEVK